MTRTVHWFRNDLRRRDNRALREACDGADALLCLFVLDPRLLEREDAGGPRLRFLREGLTRLDEALQERGQRLVVRRGDPAEVVPRVLHESGAERLVFARDTTPYARRRDDAVRARAEKQGVRVRAVKDRVLFEADEVQKKDGGSYAVYSPFRDRLYARLREEPLRPERAPRLPPPVPGVDAGSLPSPADLGVADDDTDLPTAGADAARRRLDAFLAGGLRHYARDRDRPAVDGTSRLSPYLRFGMISARECVYAARDAAADEPGLRRGARAWIDELVWRDFYAAVLQENPHVLRRSHKPAFDAVRWLDRDDELEAWCRGETGYPLVDAGMRQLRATGWVHNRVRMVVASFLTKDLLVDWRRGERFFFTRLVDGDPASNNGGWQWAASTGTDPQPWFRIFNPTTQAKRFDPDGTYVRRWIPELEAAPTDRVHEPWRWPGRGDRYPDPIVDHKERRELALARYREASERD
ncbi:MAG: deoxyribodipyrimidine photo-lyase [Myxococcota bacterium]|nr:deoxyribodipyrimidine photo-lyase [Myxococcota bacterium]